MVDDTYSSASAFAGRSVFFSHSHFNSLIFQVAPHTVSRMAYAQCLIKPHFQIELSVIIMICLLCRMLYGCLFNWSKHIISTFKNRTRSMCACLYAVDYRTREMVVILLSSPFRCSYARPHGVCVASERKVKRKISSSEKQS